MLSKVNDTNQIENDIVELKNMMKNLTQRESCACKETSSDPWKVVMMGYVGLIHTVTVVLIYKYIFST